MKTLTILKRLDIDIDICFTAISVGFSIHKRGIQFSLLFVDISFFYMSPQERLDQEKKYQWLVDQMHKEEE
jgi:hypothetical protein